MKHYESAHLCFLSYYEDGDRVPGGKREVKKTLNEEYSIPHCKFLRKNKEDVDGFIAHDDSDAYIVFAGTNSKVDVFNDLKAWDINTEFGKIHKGFWEAFLEVEGQLIELVESHRFLGRKIHIYGHSLGGAMAILLSLSLISMGVNIQSVRTYGCPRVGKKSMWNFYKARAKQGLIKEITHWKNSSDIVTRVPLRVWGYKNNWSTKEGFIDYKGRVFRKIPRKSGLFRNWFRDIFRNRKGFKINSVENHNLDGDYFKYLKKANV